MNARGDTEFTPERSALWAAGGAVAITYFYFLIYAEFALLAVAQPAVQAQPWQARGVLFCLGLGGLAGSIWAAKRFQLLSVQAQLSWSFRGCAVGAALALGATTWPLWLLAAGVSGIALGALTVNLAASLRAVVGTRYLGWVIGGGTGVAYALCNVPAVFAAGPRLQTILAAVAAASASVLSPFLAPQEPSVSPERDYAPAGVARWVLILLVLVGLDSTVFYVLQHTPELQAVTWGGPRRLWANAAVHLLAAVATGAWVNRGARLGVPLVGFGLLALGCVALGTALTRQASLLYAAGVSVYSVMLVYYPARSGRAWLAGLVYGVAGWLGSALGIGLGMGRTTVPLALVGGAAGLLLVLALSRWRALRGVVATVALTWLGCTGGAAEARADDPAAVALGREVYLAEGCIHCHSQYLRPGTADEARWGGPARGDGAPPVYGNRRQGPDLATVGTRLPDAAWHRAHLIAPRAFQPGSRMPSYAYLFADGDPRGEALVAYLRSLPRKEIAL